MKHNELRSHLESRLIGQAHLTGQIVSPITTYYAGLSDDTRPAGIYLLLGPTGVGKTFTPSILAEALHDNVNMVLRIDCAEFQFGHSIAKLVGSPPGYLGHRETHAMLSQKELDAKKSANCDLTIVIFDEIEKASDELWTLLLAILDKASLTLGDNQRVDFRNTLIFMTSNLGTREMTNKSFTFDQQAQAEDSERVALSAAKRRFSPEFMNRIDSIIHYRHLSKANISFILQNFANELNAKLARLDHPKERLQFMLTDEAEDWLIKKGYSKEYGARELRRVFKDHVKDPISEYIVNCDGHNSWSTLKVDVSGDHLLIHPIMASDPHYLIELLEASVKAAAAFPGGA